MKSFLLISLLTSAFFSAHLKAEELFTASSKARGITDFDYVVTEVLRESDYSVLHIPNFQNRTAPAFRWMLCVYTELAIERSSKFWAAIYTDNSGDKVTLVFPKSNSLTDPAFVALDKLGTEPKIMPVSSLGPFCGLDE